ncbi:MAG: hypothetical protein ACRC10_04435 [Thermoguttaceae bacterium]
MTDVKGIPVELTTYRNYLRELVTIPIWRIVDENEAGNLSMVRRNVFNRYLVLILAIPSLFSVLFAILFYRSNLTDNPVIQFWFTILILSSIPMFCVVGPLFYWLALRGQNTQHWGGKVRFRFNRFTRELYFPREKATYHLNDYRRVILGCTEGYDTTMPYMKKSGNTVFAQDWSLHPSEVNQIRFQSGFMSRTELYFLLEDHEGRWIRHDIACDRIPQPKVVRSLTQQIPCEAMFRTMGLLECYNEQHAEKEKGVREVITTKETAKETVEVKEIKEVVAKKQEKQILLQQTWGTPPRSVSLRTQLAILTNVNMTYWIFACLGLLVALFALPLCLSSFEDALHSNFQPAGKGVIVDRVETHIRMNKRANGHRRIAMDRGEPVFCYVIKKLAKEDQTDKSGMEQGQTCYDKRLYEVGEEVAIEQSGDRYRMIGSTCSALGKSGLMVGLIPFLFASIGLGGIVLGIRRGCQCLSILQSGKVEYGRLVKMSSPEPSLEGSGAQSYYCFMPDEHQNVSPMFYDPIDPRRSLMLDDLPVGTRFDPFTQTFRTSFRGVIVPLLLSLLVGTTFIALIYAVAAQ